MASSLTENHRSIEEEGSIREVKQAVRVVTGYEIRVSKLASLAGGRRPPREQCQDLLRRLKDDILGDLRQLEERKRLGVQTAIERDVVYPAIRGCRLALRVRVNSRPGREWASDLYTAMSDLTYGLSELRSWGVAAKCNYVEKVGRTCD